MRDNDYRGFLIMEQKNTSATQKVAKKASPIVARDTIKTRENGKVVLKTERFMPLKKFCAITGINIRTARYWIHKGDLKIKPKNKPKERVYVDWLSYDKEWLM